MFLREQIHVLFDYAIDVNGFPIVGQDEGDIMRIRGVSPAVAPFQDPRKPL